MQFEGINGEATLSPVNERKLGKPSEVAGKGHWLSVLLSNPTITKLSRIWIIIAGVPGEKPCDFW